MPKTPTPVTPATPLEERSASTAQLNWLRAAVLGANDGVVSVSSIILGVAGATNARTTILTAGFAGLIAGAFSMALGEYVSVSSQRDTERAYIAREKHRLEHYPDQEFEDLAKTFQSKGLTSQTAHQVAKELTAHDAVKAHLDAELKLDENDLNNPVQAAVASMLSFTAGGLVPLLAIWLSPAGLRFGVTFVAVLVALFITGYGSATVGGASRRKAVIRVVIGGAAAMIITYAVGRLFGASIS